jgi:hypothetical protein
MSFLFIRVLSFATVLYRVRAISDEKVTPGSEISLVRGPAAQTAQAVSDPHLRIELPQQLNSTFEATIGLLPRAGNRSPSPPVELEAADGYQKVGAGRE